MGIGAGIFLIAVGAVLTFALERSVEGINIDMVGVILMIAGGIGLLWSLIVMGGRNDVIVERQVDILH